MCRKLAVLIPGKIVLKENFLSGHEVIIVIRLHDFFLSDSERATKKDQHKCFTKEHYALHGFPPLGFVIRR
jgi:hypothetical protein